MTKTGKNVECLENTGIILNIWKVRSWMWKENDRLWKSLSISMSTGFEKVVYKIIWELFHYLKNWKIKKEKTE